MVNLVFVWSSYSGFYFRKGLRGYFLNVGQAEAILLRSEDNKLLLIDTGRDPNILLEELGRVLPIWVRRIDHVLLTHADIDHSGGLEELARHFDIESVFISNLNSMDISFLDGDTNVVAVGEGDSIAFGCCSSLGILWPEGNQNLENISSNNKSVAFELIYKDFRAFFGGDLESLYEDKIFKKYSLKIDLLKVGHHGSANSTSDFILKQGDPKIALLSFGKDNRYGFPKEEVINRLDFHNVEHLDTSLKRRIIWTDGESLRYRI